MDSYQVFLKVQIINIKVVILTCLSFSRIIELIVTQKYFSKKNTPSDSQGNTTEEQTDAGSVHHRVRMWTGETGRPSKMLLWV